MLQILDTLIAGKNPFGMLAFGAKAHQPSFDEMRVAGRAPANPDEWRHVRVYVEFCGAVTSLSSRWESLKLELSVPDTLAFGPDALGLLDGLSDTLHACLVGIPTGLKEVSAQLSSALGSREEAAAILRQPASLAVFADALSRHVSSIGLTAVNKNVAETVAKFEESQCDLAGFGRQILTQLVGQRSADIGKLTRVWQGLINKLSHIRSLDPPL
jgi:hypothetical protein